MTASGSTRSWCTTRSAFARAERRLYSAWLPAKRSPSPVRAASASRPRSGCCSAWSAEVVASSSKASISTPSTRSRGGDSWHGCHGIRIWSARPSSRRCRWVAHCDRRRHPDRHGLGRDRRDRTGPQPAGGPLSAGQRRRIALARALLRVLNGQARILLLDEPTAGWTRAPRPGSWPCCDSFGRAREIPSRRDVVLPFPSCW